MADVGDPFRSSASDPRLEVICEKAHLLIDADMPGGLLDFCAHKAGYDVLIQRWKQGDHQEHLSLVRHPGDALYDYVATSFAELKRQQGELLRLTQRRWGEQDARGGRVSPAHPTPTPKGERS